MSVGNARQVGYRVPRSRRSWGNDVTPYDPTVTCKNGRRCWCCALEENATGKYARNYVASARSADILSDNLSDLIG